ncbi:MAG: aldehyde dehydrogenase family protein [Cyclobacteriaceae bacterium]
MLTNTQSSVKTIQTAFDAQLQRSRLLRNQSIAGRKKKLKRLRKWVLAHRRDFQQAGFQDLGKPASEVDVTELFPILKEAKHAASRLGSWAAPRRVEGGLAYMGSHAHVQYEPKGRCLIIAPWNYPIMLSIGPIISAVAAGNTVVFKPSEFTPASNKVVGQMIDELFDPEEVCMIEGEVDVATKLLALPFDHIFFTGSPQVGKIVMTAAAKNLTSVTLELGGKSPCIIDETARLGDAAQRIAWGKWTNAGQTCVAPDYLFVHESIAEPFKKKLQKEAEARYNAKASYGSIINENHFGRVKKLFDDAISKGAKLVFGGESDSAIKFMGPTLLENTNEEMEVMQEEVFGPVLTLKVYRDIQEVIDYINDRPKPLALYLYSTSQKNREAIAKNTSSGAIVHNDNVLQFGHPHLPMGGVNNSGIGKAHSKAGFEAFSHAKAVLKQRNGISIPSIIYPPYTPFKKKVIELMLKYF